MPTPDAIAEMAPDQQHSWFEPSNLGLHALSAPADEAFVRLWKGFMTARVLMALAIALLQIAIGAFGQALKPEIALLCAGYFAATLAVRIVARPNAPKTFGRQWLLTAGIDIAMYAFLQWLQPGVFNYTPLFALPLLLVSVLGTLRLALGTAAVIALLLLGNAGWASLQAAGEPTSRLLEAALVATGYFVVALLVNQLASRLAQEERLARQNQLAVQLQTQVNELVIETLSDGVAVVDRDGIARAANPAARVLLGNRRGSSRIPFDLAVEPGWWPLLDLVQATFEQRGAQAGDVAVDHGGDGQRRLHVRTRLTSHRRLGPDRLCVLFLHDLREMEARLRTEKLAAMGRMSSAVAHEIRNPLAAIMQANALLDEELTEPGQKRLATIVQQNAQRLVRITEEVLDISRVQQQHKGAPATAAIALDAGVAAICTEWNLPQRAGRPATTTLLEADAVRVEFDPEHLRRVLVNLLDNAARYAQPWPDSLQVLTWRSDDGQAHLRVWSDGALLERAVEQHLFEPFFSSESRSTGLGLYICRELCARHGAAIRYLRDTAATRRGELAGNAFVIDFRTPAADPDLPQDAAATAAQTPT